MSISGKQPEVSAETLQGWIERGIGSGTGKSYKPFQTAHNTTTPSHSGYYTCLITGRERSYLSDLEDGLALACSRDRYVIDMRENFPLSTGLTSRICESLGVDHRRSAGKGNPLYPYTTDLLLTRDAPPYSIAFSAKQRKHLRCYKDWGSLLIEYVYWSLHKVPFFVVTEFELSKNAIESLRFLVPAASGFFEQSLERNRFIKEAQQADWSRPLIEVVREISAVAKISSDSGMSAFKDLVWSRKLECDLERRIHKDIRNAVVVEKR